MTPDPLDARWQKILPALDALARKKSDEIHAARVQATTDTEYEVAP